MALFSVVSRRARVVSLAEVLALPFFKAAGVPEAEFNSAQSVLENTVIRGFSARKVCHDASLAHDVNLIDEADQLLEFGGGDDDVIALGGNAPEQLVDFGLGADIDALRWLFDQQDARMAFERPCDRDLLLIAAAQHTDALLGIGGRTLSLSM